MKAGNKFLAQRYAKAYDGAAQDAQTAAANLQAYQTALKSLEEFTFYLNDPIIPQSVKADMLAKILPGKTLAEAFLKVIVAQKRFYLTAQIEHELKRLLDGRKGVKRVLVQSAGPARKDPALEAALARFLGAEIEVYYKQEPALLAGVKIRHGDMLLDASAQGRIKQLSKTLTGK